MNTRDTVTELLDRLSRVLLGAFGLGMLLLLVWVAVFALLGEFVYTLHGSFFAISRAHFDAIHYAGIACVKVSLFLFFLFPYLALRWELRRQR
ncbi:MAG: DUF6868 family protein [Candidatus Methylomirabilota bacterium]